MILNAADSTRALADFSMTNSNELPALPVGQGVLILVMDDDALMVSRLRVVWVWGVCERMKTVGVNTLNVVYTPT